MTHRKSWALLVALGLLLAGCRTATAPQNLSTLKTQIRAYVDSGAYERDVAEIAGRANKWVEARVARGGAKLTVIFDLDETLFLNWPHMSAMDFGYVKSEWQRWVNKAEAPTIASVREVYVTARRLGVDVVFITGRRESQRAATERNLRGIGCDDYAALFCQPDDANGLSALFKSQLRRKLSAEGRVIIANIGDQESDLVGGFAEKTFKIPNVFYITE